jgi:hypothetical protein
LIILIILGEEYKSCNPIFSSAHCPQKLSVYVPPLLPETMFHTYIELQAELKYCIF